MINLAVLDQNVDNYKLLFVLFLVSIVACTPDAIPIEDLDEEGSFLVYRRQSLIGEESFSVTTSSDSIIVRSLQGENERGRITGVLADLYLDKNFNPLHYNSRRIANDDTTNVFRMDIASDEVTILEKYFELVSFSRPDKFFPLHSNIPAAIEMMMYQYYFRNKIQNGLTTLPRGQVVVNHKGQDIININNEEITLDRYVVEGINWGGRTVWLDQSKRLIALVKANTQIREIIRKGYEDALPVFIAGNVTEQMNALATYTEDLQEDESNIKALVGGDIVDGLSATSRKNVTVLIRDGHITAIGDRAELEIPQGTKVIDVSGKTLIPGLWDMHAHSNQVQWAPAYLAGGVTTIRDNGNEIEFATAFRDAIDLDGAIGPDILLAGMTDGPGDKGNGAIRARSVEEAKEVVEMYFSKGYKQIKIYNSIAPDILKVLAEEAHRRGITVTGHVPAAVGNAVPAVESGMDLLSHSGLIMSALIPDKTIKEIGRNFLNETEVSTSQMKKARDFYLTHGTVLDPTIALSVVRSLQMGSPLETIEPSADRIAYELWEGKRFRKGVSKERSEKAKQGYEQTLKILGDFYRAGILIVAGTDNVIPVFSLYLELESYCKHAGLTPLEAIHTATIIPARAMGFDDETGTLEVGKEADIAILDKNPLEDISNIRSVSAVITNGVYYKSNPLWEAADFKPSGVN